MFTFDRHGIFFDDNDGGGAGGAPPSARHDADQTPPASPPPPSSPPPTGVQFTDEQQAEVNRIATAESRKAERKAANALAEQLGMSVDEARTFIADKQKADRDAMDATTRAQADAEEARTQATRLLADASLTNLGSLVTSALVAANVTDPQKQADLALLCRIPADTPADGLIEAINGAVGDLKGRYPQMFAPGAPAGAPGHVAAGAPPSGGAPQGPPAGGGPSTGALERGRQRAEEETKREAPVDPTSSNPFSRMNT